MTKETLLKGSFFISMAVCIVGALFKIMHLEGAETLLVIGVVTGLTFMALAIYEVNTSPHIDRTEKIMWTVGFIFMGGITGIVYFIFGRKRVMPQLTS